MLCSKSLILFLSLLSQSLRTASNWTKWKPKSLQGPPGPGPHHLSDLTSSLSSMWTPSRHTGLCASLEYVKQASHLRPYYFLPGNALPHGYSLLPSGLCSCIQPPVKFPLTTFYQTVTHPTQLPHTHLGHRCPLTLLSFSHGIDHHVTHCILPGLFMEYKLCRVGPLLCFTA